MSTHEEYIAIFIMKGIYLKIWLSWLSLAQVGPGKGFVIRKSLGAQGLVFQTELFLHG